MFSSTLQIPSFYPFTFGFQFFLSSPIKKNKQTKKLNRKQPKNKILAPLTLVWMVWFCLSTSLTTSQPWLVSLGKMLPSVQLAGRGRHMVQNVQPRVGSTPLEVEGGCGRHCEWCV